MLVDIQTTSSQTFSLSGHQEGQQVDYILAILSFIEIKLKFGTWEQKKGLFWDLFCTLVPFGTKSQIRDLIGAPE